MASLFNTKISDTYPGLIKTLDNAAISASLKELTDGSGNQSGLFINTAGDFKATGILEFGSLKDTGENITITKFVDEADGIANNDNDTTIPTSAAVVDYVASRITLEDLDFSGDTGTGSVDLDSQVFAITGTSNQIVTTASGQGISFAFPSAGIVLPDGSTATTQTDGDNSTKIATTAYVDTAIQGHDTLAEVLAGGNTSGANDIIMLDGQKVNYGTNSDLQIFHSSGTSIIDNTIGDLIIKVSQDDGDIIFQSDNGVGAISTYFRVDGGVKQTIFEESIRINDNKNLNIGSSGADLRINHDGTDSFIQNFVGNLEIQNGANDKDIIFKSDDGSGGVAEYFKLDGTNLRILVSKPINLIDGIPLQFGNSQDLRIYHNGNNSYIQDAGTGSLKILAQDLDINNAAETASMIRAIDGAQVELYYGGVKKLETTSAGINITGGADTQTAITGTTTAARLDIKTNSHHRFLQTIESDGKFRLFNQTTNSEQFSVASNNDATFNGNVNITGQASITNGIEITGGNANFADNSKARFGASADLEIYHNGSNSYIKDTGTGNLSIQGTQVDIMNPDGSEYKARFLTDGAAQLYYDNSLKLSTTNTGISVTGLMVASGDVYAEDNIYLTDTGTARAAISLDSSDRDNLNIKAISLGSLMRFYTQDTLALALDASQNASFSQSVTIAGDLTVNGTTTTVNTEHFNVEDPLISMAKDNAANSVDIGFYGRYNDGTNRYLGLFSDASDSNTFKLFKGVETEPTATVDVTATGYTLADLDMNNLSVEGTSALNGDITVGDTSSAFIGMARAGANYLAATNASGELVFRTGGTTAALTLDNSQNASFAKNVSLLDSKVLNLGSGGNDLTLYHTGGNSYIRNNTGNLEIRNQTSGASDLLLMGQSVNGLQTYITLDGSIESIMVNKDILMFNDGNNGKIKFGASQDLEIYHDGSHSYIKDAGTGDLVILSNQVSINNAANTENIAKFIENGAVELYYNNSKTFETTTGGIKISGTSANNKIESYFDGDYTSGFKFSDLNGGIWYDAGADDLYLNANHANSQVILQSGGSTTLTLEANNNSTFAGTITASGGSSNNNDDANILTLNASEHARLKVDTSSTNGHRATLVLESNGNELLLSTTGSASELTSVGNLTVTSSATTFTGIVETDKIFVAKGQNVTHATSAIKISQELSSKSQIRFYGADASTPGSLQFMGTSSDGSTGQERMLITSAGAIEIKGAATTLNGNAFITNTDAVTTYGSTQSASVPKPMAWFTGAERLRLDANGAIYNVNATAQSFWGSNNAGNPSNVTGTSNSSFGYGAGNALTTGYQNVSIGRDAGGALTTGLNNVNVGTNAGASNVDGQHNTYIGTAAGYTSPGQNYNTFVGYEAGFTNEANENTAVGRLALHQNSSGTRNVAVGVNALRLNTTADANTAVGYLALENNTEGNSNTALGYQAGDAITTGDANIAIGVNSLGSNSTGSRNVVMGQNAGASITGSDNVAIGYEALNAATADGQNVAIGVNAALKFNGSRLVAIGYGAGKELLNNVDNVFIGQSCGENRTTGVANTFVGSYANYSGGTGCCNTGFGKATGYSLTSGVQNTFLGRQAGYSVTTAGNNTLVGHNTGLNATGGQNTLIGSGAGDAITTGNHNNIFGYNCEASSVSGTDQIVIGTNGQVGKGNSTGFISPGTGGVYQGNNSTTWSTTSDKRIKKNIVDNNKGLEIIDKIQVRNFEYRTEEEIIDFENPKSAVVNKKGVQLGVIAQEIEKILPETITEESTGVKTVNADNLTWYLINAVKELKAEVDKLKQECKCK